ncbi:MAG: response regulator transcription factor [Pirellulaceae bacterium]
MPANDPIVYVVDDDQGSRESLRALVRSMGLQAEICGSAEEFLASFDPDRPGCLITDVRMPGMSGLDLQEKLAGDGIRFPVIIITAHAETPLTVKAIKQGAVTVLEKPCRDYELYDSIRDALAQDAGWRARSSDKHKFQQALAELSAHEREVLDLMLMGEANKNIAKRLDVSVRTIENRRQKIFEKTEMDSLAQLLRRFYEDSGE